MFKFYITVKVLKRLNQIIGIYFNIVYNYYFAIAETVFQFERKMHRKTLSAVDPMFTFLLSIQWYQSNTE